MSHSGRPAPRDADRRPPDTPPDAAAAFSSVADIAGAVLAGGRAPILLLSDFDGTLCEFRNDPESVHLPESRRAALSTLARRPAVCVGIVSGRRAADIRDRAALDGPVYYAGLHGMEIFGPDRGFSVDQLAAHRDRLQELAGSIAAAVRPLDGVFLEDKDLSVALHVRAAAPGDRARAEETFWAIVSPALHAGRARVQRGHHVFELLPDIAWNKGNAVHWIETDATRRLAAPVRPVYLGDDRTDEHAFEAVGDRGVTVIIGRAPSIATHRLPDPAAVERLLARLVTLTADR